MTRRALDHYPTPAWCVEALIEHEAKRWGSVLDPACGEGDLLSLFAGSRTLGLELHPGRARAARARGHEVTRGDALTVPWPACEAVVTNPPYTHAAAFVRRAIEHAPEVYALLRITFLEPTADRRELLEQQPPDVLILPRRPTFTGRGSDSATSAWFCWPGLGRLVWLPVRS